MDMPVVYMGSQNILIFVIEKCLAKLLSDEDRPFGSDLARGKRLYYVLGFVSAESCSDKFSCFPELF